MDEEIDRIPLIGVDFVKAHFETVGMQGDGADEGSKSQDYFCLQIATNPEGYNSAYGCNIIATDNLFESIP